jgi:hypothetical protein
LFKDVHMMDNRSTAHRRPALAAPSIRAAAVAVALATTACSSDAPTRPASQPPPSAVLAITPAARGVAGALLADASGRLIPSLADATARAKLRGYLDDLSAALDADNAANARRQIALARQMIVELADSPDAADLAVVGIALDQVEAQLDGALAPQIQQEP